MKMSLTSVLQTHALSYQKQRAKLLDDISIDVNAGDVMAVVGPNGAGKSTLIHLLCNELQASSGRIMIAGKESSEWSLQERAKHVAVLPQFSLLNFPYTVEQVVGLGRVPHATGMEIDKAIVSKAMEALDIQYLQGRLYPALSGGEKQRCQIARVLCQIWQDSDASLRLLLLDEPSSALDLGHQQQLMRLLRELSQHGVAIVMVVHDVNLALGHANKLLALSCGRALAYGNTTDVINESLLQELFHAELRLIHHPEKNTLVVLT